ncbi:FAD-dependent oxidoreductase [Halobacillus litoralis]|uniref:FAD-dependent oxidoreductase n=1 Tax=Halobacillus litoralis TaxID=45668 RepID=UPI001CD3D8E4|nr:FAD-dependent oxidoreductase [Halobacillus litoralis]MCA0972607.1 FAD-dependent oxidoreductase [Halobacillus litoralis]
MSKRLLLVGAGHAHLEVIHQLKERKLSQVDVCLINPSSYQYYSGMFSGYTEGLYEEEDTRVDLEALTKRAGIHFIKKSAGRILPKQKKVVCSDRSVYPFDVVSFDTGSRSLPPSSIARTIKPNYQFIPQVNEIRKTTHPLIVGGGAAGCELAMSIQTYKNKHQIPGNVRVISAERILSDAPAHVSRKLRSIFSKKGIQLWEHERASEVLEDCVITDKGNRVRHTGVLWLGGAEADSLFQDSDVACDEQGFAYVRDTLQFEGYDHVFGAGDCVTMTDHPHLAKSGVYAVRQGPVLWENLQNYLKGNPLKRYNPQTNALYILSTGHKKGLLTYGPIAHHSHQAWKLKNKIDTEFIQKYKSFSE